MCRCSERPQRQDELGDVAHLAVSLCVLGLTRLSHIVQIKLTDLQFVGTDSAKLQSAFLGDKPPHADAVHVITAQLGGACEADYLPRRGVLSLRGTYGAGEEAGRVELCAPVVPSRLDLKKLVHH